MDNHGKRTSEEVQSNTSRGNDHDPLCPSDWYCICLRLAKVRVDEREKAAQRVEAAVPHWAMCCTSSPAYPFHPEAESCGTCCCVVGVAVAAARGEEYE